MHVNTLAVHLRKLRKERGTSQVAVARAVNVSKSLIAAFEQGRLIPQPDTAGHLDTFFGTGEDIRQMSADALAERERVRAQGRPALPVYQSWPEVEAAATMLRNYQPTTVPGLLQTPDYAKFTLEADATLTDAEIQAHLSGRLARQEILRKDHPPYLITVIDEAALRRRVGARLVMQEQCEALLKACNAPNVTVQVIPEDAGFYAGLSGPLALATTPHGTYAFIDDQAGGRLLTDSRTIDRLMGVWEAVRGYALNQQQTRDLLARMAESWE